MKKTRMVFFLIALAGGAVAQDGQDHSKWHYTEEPNAMEPAKSTRAAVLDSDEPDKATLIVRCNGTTRMDMEVFVATNHVVEDHRPVRLKFDEEKPHTLLLWTSSADYSSIFFGRPYAAIQQIARARKLVIEWFPFEQTATTATFTGLSSVPLTDCRSDAKLESPQSSVTPAASQPASASAVATSPVLPAEAVPATPETTTQDQSGEQPADKADEQTPAKAKVPAHKAAPKCAQGTYWGDDPNGKPVCVWSR